MTESKGKPDSGAPPLEAEILPFRAPAKPKPPQPAAGPVRIAPPPQDQDNIEPLSTGALVKIGLLVVFLIVAGVWLMNTLRDIGRLEDCAMQGRRNCVTIPLPDRNR